MHMARLLFIFAMAAPLMAQNPQERDRRFDDIQARHQRGEELSPEDADLRFADWAKQHPARESTGMIPLCDLGASLYQGEQGGLYPGGLNAPPAAHLAAGLAIAKKIVPLDSAGHPSRDGRIVLLTIGMSNATHAQGSQTAALIARPEAKYWSIPPARLEEAGATPAQVQAIWLKQANGMPKEAFPAEPKIAGNPVGPDGTHPSIEGREKVAQLLLAFFEKDPTAAPWFAKH
jgi:hypothetical protein